MVQILLMLKVLFTQDSKVENLFCGAQQAWSSAIFFLRMRFKSVHDDFLHDFARMTDEADSSVLLAEL